MGPKVWIVICFPDRREAIALRFHAARKPRAASPWSPVRRMRLTPGGCGQNFLRFCNPATLRKPVICLSWQIPLDVSVSPLICTPRKRNKATRFEYTRWASMIAIYTVGGVDKEEGTKAPK